MQIHEEDSANKIPYEVYLDKYNTQLSQATVSLCDR